MLPAGRVATLARPARLNLGENVKKATLITVVPLAAWLLGCAVASAAVITGSPGGDTLWGTQNADAIRAGGGNDTVLAQRGDDAVFGGGGSDSLFGRGGNDRVKGGPGRDEIYGDDPDSSQGNDKVVGGGGNDYVFGGSEQDRVVGGAGSDVLVGHFGDDTIVARDGQVDRVDCGNGSDIAFVDREDVIVKGCNVVRVG